MHHINFEKILHYLLIKYWLYLSLLSALAIIIGTLSQARPRFSLRRLTNFNLENFKKFLLKATRWIALRHNISDPLFSF